MHRVNKLKSTFRDMLLPLLLALAPAASEASKTCADYAWGDWPEVQPAVNNPAAAHATEGISKAQYIEKNKVNSMLTCQPTLLTTLPAVSTPTDAAFHARVRSATGKNKDMLAKAIYEKFLINKGHKFSGQNIQTRTWNHRQAADWCLENHGHDKTSLPNNLPSLEQGIEQLDTTAITLAWQLTQNLSSKILGKNCNEVIKEFRNTGVFLNQP